MTLAYRRPQLPSHLLRCPRTDAFASPPSPRNRYLTVQVHSPDSATPSTGKLPHRLLEACPWRSIPECVGAATVRGYDLVRPSPHHRGIILSLSWNYSLPLMFLSLKPCYAPLLTAEKKEPTAPHARRGISPKVSGRTRLRHYTSQGARHAGQRSTVELCRCGCLLPCCLLVERRRMSASFGISTCDESYISDVTLPIAVRLR